MSRVQLALNVNDLGSAIEFYSKLFATQPAKVREGYANFAIAEPPLKLVLIENPGEGGTLNHLGVEVESADLVASATDRLRSEGLIADLVENTTCCFAVQDKVWVSGPEIPWEIYTVLADASVMLPPESSCCAPGDVAVVAPETLAPEMVALGVKPGNCC
jgi:Glyoxalase/Bleomycin resistance protein/Dioxygenase superfamily